MKALILTIDNLTPQFDRRILHLDDSLRDLNFKTSIMTLGNESFLEWHKGRPIFQISKFPRLNFPLEWKKFISIDEIPDIFEIQVSKIQVIKNKLRFFWDLIPLKIRCILKLRLNFLMIYIKRIEYLVNFSSISYKSDILSNYLDYAFKLYSANQSEKYDLYIGTDIPSGLAALLLANKFNCKSWYDAHEFSSEQQWLKAQPGYSSKLKELEKLIVREVNIFSTVSEELCKVMTNTFQRKSAAYTLTNATFFNDQIEVDSKIIKTFEDAKGTSRVLLFHGVLSESRGLGKFVDIFEELNLPNWKLIFIGYSLSPNLKQKINQASKVIYFEPISSCDILHIVKMSDAIVMPYPVNDINTKFGFANKLGDCIALKKPYLYNTDLTSIDKVAKKTSTGVGFNWQQISQNPEFLAQAINALSNLNSNWESAENSFGFTDFSNKLKLIINSF